LTNRRIADELGIATATATLHVEHIRGKLGFHTRAQIATWVSRSC
jgi:non-specific serine/threonine protein kinase